MTRYYKWTVGGKAIYGQGKYAPIGEAQPRIEGALKMCERGYHVCTAEQVSHWCGTELWEVEVDEEDVVATNRSKTLCRTWKGIRKLNWTTADMVDYAQACADRAKLHADSCNRADDDINKSYACKGACREYAENAYFLATRVADSDSRVGSTYARDAAFYAALTANVNTPPRDDCNARVRERRWQREWIEERIGEKLGGNE